MAKYISKFTGEEIDYRLSSMDNKVGATAFDRDSMKQYGFRTQEDKNLWMETKDSSLIISEDLFNFSGTQNQIKVVNNMDSGTLYFTTKNNEAKITCSFLSQQKGITDSAWQEVNEDFEVTVAVDKGNSGAFVNIITNQQVLNGNSLTFDIRNSLATGTNRVRVLARGLETGASGSFTYVVNLTTMYLSPSNFTWYKPFVQGETYMLGGMNIGGNLDKVMRICVTKEESYIKEYEVNIGSDIYTSTAYTYEGLEFPTAGTGVYNVEIWLDANGLESEHLKYNIICVAEKDKYTAQLVSVSDASAQVMNFAENTLFNYCIYNGGQNYGSPHLSLDTIISTNKNNLISQTLVNVETAKAIPYTTSLELEVSEASMQLSATMSYGNEQQVVYPIDNSKAYPATKECAFLLNPASRSNAQENKEIIVNGIDSTTYDVEWANMGFIDGTDGWTVDDQGRKCLSIPAFSKANIAFQPFKGLSTPITLEFVYKVMNSSNFDDPIITICDGSKNGITITPKNVLVRSSNETDNKKQDYNTGDEEILDIIVTLVPNYKTNYGNLVQVYCNGDKVRSFEFTNLQAWNIASNIILGNDTADLYLYKMRVYYKGFDKSNAMANFINSLPTAQERELMYNYLHKVTDSDYNVDYDACVRNGYNTMVIEMLGGKDIPSKANQEEGLKCNLKINVHNISEEDDLDDEMTSLLTGILIEDETIEGQGTTAMTYGRWNFRWKLSSKYGKRRITAKKNVASSMQSHKMGGTRLFNYLHKECVGANEVKGKVAVLQYPVYGFQKVLLDDGINYRYDFIGHYTIGADKGDKHTFGYDTEEYKDSIMHLEGSDHTPKTVGFDYPWEHSKFIGKSEAMGAIQADGTIIGAWEVGMAGEYDTDTTEDEGNVQTMLNSEFKPAYNVAYHNSPFIIGTTESIATINANIDEWQKQTDAKGNSYSMLEVWDSSYNLYFYNQATKQYTATGINMLTDLGIATSEVSSLSLEEKNNLFISKRQQRFKDNWGTYWHKQDAIFHYVFCMIFGATDNFKKNTYPYKFATLASGGKWRWRQDDLDTIFDINNQGLAAKLYSILIGDTTSSGSVYRGDNSAFWTLIKETQQAEIKQMVHKVLDAMVKAAPSSNTQESLVNCVKKFFWNYAQEYFPQSSYNEDTEWTYEDIWYNKNLWKEVHPLNQALGGHYEAEKDWVTMRLLFIASYYNYGAFNGVDGYKDVSTGQMVYGGAGAHTYQITPAIDMNPTIVRGSTEAITYGDRVKAGDTIDLTVSDTSGADTRIYVQGLDWISDIGDLSTLQVSEDNSTLNIGSKRLQTLKIGDETPENVTSNIKALTLGSCPSMRSIDARNLSSLQGTVDLTLLPRLQEALFGATSVTTITLPSGAKLQYLQLPSTLTNVQLKNLHYLTEEGLEYDTMDNVQSITIENCAQLNPFELLKTIYNGDGTALTDIRLIGFVYDGTADDVTILANLARDLDKNGNTHEYRGIDAEGNPIPIPAIQGTINVEGSIYEDDEAYIRENFGGALILNVQGGYYIKFADPEVKRVLLANKVGDGVGITTEQAEAVTSIGTWFKGNTTIETFDEFEKFTGVKNLGTASSTAYESFSGCTYLKTIKLPRTITIINASSFRNCTSLYHIEGLDNVESIGRTFANCTSLNQPIIMPNLTQMAYGGCFANCPITKFSAPKLTSIPDGLQDSGTNYGVFHKCTNLTEVDLDWENITKIGGNAFNGCTSLVFEDLQLPNLTSLGQNAFYGVKIKEISDLGKITSIPSGNYKNPLGINEDYLESFTLPDTITTIPEFLLYSCKNMSEFNANWENITSLGGNAFNGCSSLVIEELSMPSLTTLGAFTFGKVKIGRITDLGKITTTPSGNYSNFLLCDAKYLKSVVFPETITSFKEDVLRNNTNIEYIIIKATTPPTLDREPFVSNYPIYVPDSSVEAYKAATNWSTYADRIKPLSEYAEYTYEWVDITSEMENNKAYFTALSVGQQFTGSVVEAQYTQGFKTIIYSLDGYNVVRLTGTGATSPRLWCFIDENNLVISVASAGAQASETKLVVPKNAKKIVVTFAASSVAMKLEVGVRTKVES